MSDFTLHKQTSLEDVVKSLSDFIYMPDTTSIRVALAAYFANSISTDPVWLFLIGASASGKSEFIQALSHLDGAMELSSLTPQTFLSGFNAGKNDDGTSKDPSLLNRIKENTVFLLKDFTTVLNLRPDSKNEIMSQLREIYDGKISKSFGTGANRVWKGKVGFISGCTYAIEDEIMMNAKYGDRFLYWKLPDVDLDLAMDKQLGNYRRETELREAIKESIVAFANTGATKGDWSPPMDVMKALRGVVKFTMKARGPIRWDYSFRDIISVGKAENPMRTYKQLLALGGGLMMLRGGEWNNADWHILTKIALDSVPSWRMDMVRMFLKNPDEWLSTTEIGLRLNLSTKTARRTLEELLAHEIVEKFVPGPGFAHSFRLTDQSVEWLSHVDNPFPEKRKREDIKPLAKKEEDEYVV